MENLLWLALALIGWAVYSVALAASPHPEELERRGLPALALWISVLGRASFLRHNSGPGTLHLPLTEQPWWLEALSPLPRQEVPGESVPPSAPLHPRIRLTPAVSWLAPAVLLLLVTGCGSTPLDKARMEYARALRVATTTNSRFREQSRDFQEKNIRRIGPHTAAAAQWQGAFVVKRQPVEDQIRRCDEVLSNANDLLLLSDDVRGIPEAKNATACVGTLRDLIAKLFDGGL